MIRWRRLVVGMGLLLVCGPVALVCAQDSGLDAPLTWTRGDLESDISPAPPPLCRPLRLLLLRPAQCRPSPSSPMVH